MTTQSEERSVDNGVIDNPEKSRFELPVEGDVAVAYYRRDGDRITLTHTEVPQHLSGQGIGSRLAKGVFEALRTSRSRAVAKCPFMAAYADRHPEYSTVLDG
jgi:predicted GNAT family acetyltransferase